MEDENILLKKSLGEMIAEHLKQDIFDKRIQFGDRLVEMDLASRFQVSRSSIREALKLLEKEGLVKSKARKGTFVSKFTRKDLDEMIELRLMIEPRAFRNAIMNMDEEDFLQLEEIVEKMKEEAMNKNWNELFNLDSAFHRYVIHRCNNSRLIQIYDSISMQIRVYLAHLDQYYSNPINFYLEHKELLNIMIEQNLELIEEKMEEHIIYVEEGLFKKLPNDSLE